jgi:hypothetical protein
VFGCDLSLIVALQCIGSGLYWDGGRAPELVKVSLSLWLGGAWLRRQPSTARWRCGATPEGSPGLVLGQGQPQDLCWATWGLAVALTRSWIVSHPQCPKHSGKSRALLPHVEGPAGRALGREGTLFLYSRLFWPSEDLGWKNQEAKRNVPSPGCPRRRDGPIILCLTTGHPRRATTCPYPCTYPGCTCHLGNQLLWELDIFIY